MAQKRRIQMAQTSVLPSGKQEILPFIYWSTRRIGVNYAGAGKEILFFNYVEGQSVDSVVASEIDTNLKKSNTIEHPNRFWIKQISVSVIPNVLTEDSIGNLNLLLNNSKFTLKVSVKEKIVICPITSLLDTTQLLPATVSRFTKPYTLKVAEILLPEVPFTVSLKFGTDMIALTNTAIIRLVVRLHGSLVRLADM